MATNHVLMFGNLLDAWTLLTFGLEFVAGAATDIVAFCCLLWGQTQCWNPENLP